MPIYRTDILASVRRELNDNGPAQVWSNAIIYGWLTEAIFQLSLDLPKKGYASFYAVPGQREYPLNAYTSLGLSARLGVLSVEAPRGRPLPAGDTNYRQEGTAQTNALLGADTLGRVYANVWEVVEFTQDQPYLIFRYAPVELGGPSDLLIAVWFNAGYNVPPDDATPLENHFSDDPMLVYFICGRALSWLAEQRGKRADPNANWQRMGTAGYYEKLYQQGLKVRQRKDNKPRTWRLVGDL